MRHLATLLFTLLFCANVGAQQKTYFTSTPCAIEDAGCNEAVEWRINNDARAYAGVRGNNEKSRQFHVTFSYKTGVGENKIEYRQTSKVQAGSRSSTWHKRGYKKCSPYGQTALCPTTWEMADQPAVGDLYQKHLQQLRELETNDALFKGVAVNN